MKVLEIYIKKLRFKNYANRTIETYVHYLEKFLESENIKDPYQVTTKQIVDYLENRFYTSVSQQNQIIGSLKLFAKYILDKKDVHLSKIERPKKERKLPRVIDAEILAEKITAIENLKHRSLLSLGLSCGLRVREVLNLKWTDIDRNRNLLFICNSKGRKDRYVHLNNNMISLLEDYWREFKPKQYIFNGQFSVQYSSSSCQKLIKKYISPKASYHLLRHAYATYAVDNGTGLAPLAGAMGHNSTKTTEVYFHLSNKSLKSIPQAV